MYPKVMLDMAEASFTLVTALDYVGLEHLNHGKKVAYVAARVGQMMGWSGPRLADLILAAALHDCGVASTREHKALSERLIYEEAGRHCEFGAALLANVAPYRRLAPLVRHHHTLWNQADKVRDTSAGDLLLANCIFLADRVETMAFHKPQPALLAYTGDITARVRQNAGKLFAPQLVEAFEEVSRPPAFWLDMLDDNLEGRLTGWLGVRNEPLDLDALGQLSLLFSRVVDSKSPFTAEHSHGVARLAAHLGGQLGLNEEAQRMLEVAGHLHDLGKIRVPDEVLDKPGPLDADERAIMNRHTYDTYGILSRMRGLDEVARWAALHHETLDGGGYPFGLQAGDLPLEARIVAVSDVFQALAQNRPYREPLPLPKIWEIITGMVRSGKIDGDVVATARQDETLCLALANNDPALDSLLDAEPLHQGALGA